MTPLEIKKKSYDLSQYLRGKDKECLHIDLIYGNALAFSISNGASGVDLPLPPLKTGEARQIGEVNLAKVSMAD